MALKKRKQAFGVLRGVASERRRQDEKWGEQNHPDHEPGNEGWFYNSHRAERWKEANARREWTGGTAWDGILCEEVYEALSEKDPAKLRAELVQVAAVTVAWIEAIDRRSKRS